MNQSQQIIEALDEAREEVIRPEGHDAANDVPRSWTRKGHLYRAMTDPEYKATVGAGKPIKSRGDFSFASEGTNFAEDADESESIVNFGRDDPRKTGKSTYLIEIKPTPEDGLVRHRDGTWKTQGGVPQERITRIWKMSAKGGAVVARRIKG